MTMSDPIADMLTRIRNANTFTLEALTYRRYSADLEQQSSQQTMA